MRIKLLLAAICVSLSALSADFSTQFADSTLRLDYVLSGGPGGSSVSLHRQGTLAGWAGRRHRLGETMPHSRASFTLTDPETGDTLYRTSFSSLFLEWLDIDEARQTRRAFQATLLAPMPRGKVRAKVELCNAALEPVASMSHIIDPDDILLTNYDARRHYPVRDLHIGGRVSDAIDVVILPEGFTAGEMPQFMDHAATAVEAILSHEPFRSMADRFNFRAVEVPSDSSGVSVPLQGRWLVTPFSSHFSTFWSDRYLTSPEVFAINDAAASAPYEHIIVLANTDVYGGGGILNSYTLTTTGHKNFRPVVVHEFGHSFGGLADEYWYDDDVMLDSYPLDVEPPEANVTTRVNFHGKWEELVESGEASLVEGGAYSAKGVWRAADDCRMRTNTATEFCPACQLALKRLIEFYTH